MKKHIAILLLALACSANIAYSVSRPSNTENMKSIKIPGSMSDAKIKTHCDTAREDQQRQIENLPKTTERLVQCYSSGGDASNCETIFDSFKCYYGYLKDASARVKQYCN